jgi:hypothetical protein
LRLPLTGEAFFAPCALKTAAPMMGIDGITFSKKIKKRKCTAGNAFLPFRAFILPILFSGAKLTFSEHQTFY